MTPTSSYPYIMVVRDDDYWLIGPFADMGSARAWAKENWDQSPGADDPRWQILSLVGVDKPPAVFSPTQAVESGYVP